MEPLKSAPIINKTLYFVQFAIKYNDALVDFTPFSNACFTLIKKCKVNSRNYTYDGPTFSIESATVKDALVIYNAPLIRTHLFVFGTHLIRIIA